MYCIDKQAGFIYNGFMKSVSMKKWIIIFAAVLIICIGAFIALRNSGAAGNIAVIRVDGDVYKKIDLNTVAVAYDMEIKTKYGYNKINVSSDGICVVESNCRDHICIDQGRVNTAGVPIVCLPHRLTIEIEGGNIDG